MVKSSLDGVKLVLWLLQSACDHGGSFCNHANPLLAGPHCAAVCTLCRAGLRRLEACLKHCAGGMRVIILQVLKARSGSDADPCGGSTRGTNV